MINHRAFPLPDTCQTKIVSEHGKEMIFDCSWLVYRGGMAAYEYGKLVQDAFPTLTDDEREFLISGMLPEEFEALCAELEEFENQVYSTGDDVLEDS